MTITYWHTGDATTHKLLHVATFDFNALTRRLTLIFNGGRTRQFIDDVEWFACA